MSFAVTSLVQLPQLGIYHAEGDALSRLARREQVVLAALAVHLDADPASKAGRAAWPGVDRLSTMTGYARRTVLLALAGLTSGGIIRRERRTARGERGRLVGQSSLTTVHPAVLAAAAERRRLKIGDGRLDWAGIPLEAAPRGLGLHPAPAGLGTTSGKARQPFHRGAKVAPNPPSGTHTPPSKKAPASAAATAARTRRAAAALPAADTHAAGGGGVICADRAEAPIQDLLPISDPGGNDQPAAPAAAGAGKTEGTAGTGGGARGLAITVSSCAEAARADSQGGSGGGPRDPAAEARQVLAWLAQHGVAGLEVQLARRGPGGLGGTFQPPALGGRLLGLQPGQAAPESVLAAQAALSQPGTRPVELYTRVVPSAATRVVVLDDVHQAALARLRVLKCARVVVETSPGSHHVLLLLPKASPRIKFGPERGGELDKSRRAEAQRRLAAELGSDPAATSGDRLWRLPGSLNWKRGGAPFVAQLLECVEGVPVPREWLLAQRRGDVAVAVPAQPAPAPAPVPAKPAAPVRGLAGVGRRGGLGVWPPRAARPAGGGDGSGSGDDMRLAWQLARRGVGRAEAARLIAERAAERGKGDAARCADYARRTVAKVRYWRS
jgi:hypothetical protein